GERVPCMMMRRWLVRSGLLAQALSAHIALAQAAQPDARAASVALYQEGERLAAAGDAAQACRKYGESYSLDSQLDALLKWADCLEHEAKWASAFVAFRDAV